MKILLITDTYQPEKGGAEKYFFKLKNMLQSRQELEVFSLGFGPKKTIGKDFVILPETSFKLLRHCWRMFFNPIHYFLLRHWILKIKPDVIHLHNINKYTISLLKAVKGFPLIQTTHDFSFVCPMQWNVHQNLKPCLTGFHANCWQEHKRNVNYFSYFLRLFAFLRKKKYLKKSINQFIAPSTILKNYLMQQGFNNISFIPPFIEKKEFPDFEKMQPQHFLYIGQLEKQKGVNCLIEEFALACNKNKNIILKIVGHGREKKVLKQRVNQLNLQERIHFIDWTNDPSVFYQECSAVIFPSIGLESFGLVITEAMAQARAVIGSNRGPTLELIEDGKTGLLFDPLQKGQLAEKILLIAKQPDLAQCYGQQGWNKLQECWNDDTVLEEILKVYGQCYTANHIAEVRLKDI